MERNRFTIVVLTLALLGGLMQSAHAQFLLPTGSDWKYLDDGSDQGTAWSQVGFDDSGWTNGLAPLGYDDVGDPPIATTVSFGPDDQNKFVTTYFRTTFTVGDASSVTNLRATLRRDDGAIVYLNGMEIIREKLTNEVVDYLSFAEEPAVGGADEATYWPFTVDPTLLVDGTNLVAIEIHQVNATSSDQVMDFSLEANPVPTVEITSPTNNAVITGVNLTINTDAVPGGSPINLVEFFEGANKIGEANADPFNFTWIAVPEGNYDISAIATDDTGLMATSAVVNVTLVAPPPSLVARGSIWRILDGNVQPAGG